MAPASRNATSSRYASAGRSTPVSTKRCERLERHHPWRDRGCEVLRQKGTQRLVLPRLDIARRPVIQQAQSKDMRLGLCQRYAAAELVPTPDEYAHFQLVIQPPRGGELRPRGPRRQHLSHGE